MAGIKELTHDSLTGLPDHAGFLQLLGDALERVKAGESSLALGLFDLDGFGAINERHGREAGDAVIRRLAEHLAAAVGGAGSAQRYGGDAVSVLLPGLGKEEAFLLMEAARRGLEPGQLVEVGGQPLKLRVTVSGGVAAAPDDGGDAQDLQRKLLAALYRAKVSGPNKVCLAREEKMVTKTVHYTQGQLEGLARLARRLGSGEAALLREAVDDLLRKYNA